MSFPSACRRNTAQTREENRLLAHLSHPGATAIIASASPERVLLGCQHNGVTLSRGHISRAAAEALLARGAIRYQGESAFALSTAEALPIEPANRAPSSKVGTTLCEDNAPNQKDRASPQPTAPRRRGRPKSTIRTGVIDTPEGRKSVRIDTAESPLAWLHSRRDAEGRPLIDNVSLEAGERLRRDITMAQLMPRVTANWSPAAGHGAAGGQEMQATEAMIAARLRVTKALNAMEGDMANLLLDVCGFLKGLEQVERERRWPPRSGKIVLKMALNMLASHYGLSREVRGPAQSRGIRQWRA